MIERVGNTRYTDAYMNSSKHTEAKKADAPAFLLGDEEEGVVWDRQSDKKADDKKKDISKDQSKNTKKDSYESSLKETPKEEKKKEPEKIKKPAFMEPWSVESFTGAVKNLFKSIKFVFKGFFDFIWYGEQKDEKTPSKENEAVAENDTKESVSKTEEPKKKEEIKKPEKPYEITMEYVMKMNEGKTPARSTDLLTTYDKFGKTTYPSKSDAQRILHVDKSNEA